MGLWLDSATGSGEGYMINVLGSPDLAAPVIDNTYGGLVGWRRCVG
jgi:hypothetical protein